MTARLAAFTGFVILVAGLVATLRPVATETRELLAVNFAHADHTEENCIVCHHNFVDRTGSGLCIDCHKRHPEIASLIEIQFHDLCRGCHRDRQDLREDAGPAARCFDCHQADPNA